MSIIPAQKSANYSGMIIDIAYQKIHGRDARWREQKIRYFKEHILTSVNKCMKIEVFQYVLDNKA